MERVDHLLGAFFHLDHKAIDLCDEVIVRDVDGDRDGQTGRRRDQRHLDAAGHGRRFDLARDLDRLEGLNHADHRAEEAREGRDVRQGGQPHEAPLQSSQLNETSVLDRLHDALGSLFVPAQAGQQYRRRRSL